MHWCLLAVAADLVDAATYDTVIVGAGPAGLQVANYLHEMGRSYVVLEKADSVGSFFRTWPRAGGLISFNKVENLYEDPEVALRWDWNSLLTGDTGTALPFRQVTTELYPRKEDMVTYLERYAAARNLTIRLKQEVLKLDPPAMRGGDWEVVTPQEVLRARTVIWAGGNAPHTPPVPGIELAEQYSTMDWSSERLRGKKVLVLGKGNAALEVADLALDVAKIVHLVSPSPIKLAWNTRHPGHARANHFRILDMYQLKMLHGMLDAHVVSIEPPPVGGRPGLYVTIQYTHADSETETLIYDHVISAAGFRANFTALDAGVPIDRKLGGRFPDMGPSWESPSQPGLYFAGTIMQANDFKKSASAFVGGFRYNCRCLARLVDEALGGPGPKTTRVERTAAGVAKAVENRVNRASGLWDLFGFIGDVILDGEDAFDYVEELPLALIHERYSARRYWTVNFEWGAWTGDVMAIERHPSAGSAVTNKFLHPVVRGYEHGQQVSEHHILEDLFATYRYDGDAPGTSVEEAGIVYRRQGLTPEEYHRRHHWDPLLAFWTRQVEARDHAVDERDMELARQAARITAIQTDHATQTVVVPPGAQLSV